MNADANVPAWAMKIIRTVAREQRHKLPEYVTWRNYTTHRRAAGSWSSDDGRLSISNIKMRRTRISINGDGCEKFARWERLAAKLTLLHELAHWLTGEGHTRGFWLKAFELYRRFRIPMGYALRNEAAYKQGALNGYWAGRDPRGRRPTGRVKITTTVDVAARAGGM